MEKTPIKLPKSFRTLSECQRRRLLAELKYKGRYDEVPCDIKTFIESPEYLNAGVDCWENVKEELIKIFNENPLSRKLSKYKEAVNIWGIGSGKSEEVSYIFAYALYRLQCYTDPQSIYGMARGSTIALLNMSKTASQAKKVVFGAVGTKIKNSPWFQTYCKPDPNINSELRFDKNIVIFPGNSSSSTPLGYNVFVANIDEASFFTETEDHDVAEDVYDGLDRRIVGRFNECGFLAITSSPQYIDDFTERKLKEAQHNKKIRGTRRATWDNRPDDKEAILSGDFFELKHPLTHEPIRIPNKYKDAFNRNASKAWRDFGAVPSLVLEPFLSEREISNLKLSMERFSQPILINDHAWTGETFPKNAIYHVHIDLAVSRDKCGFAMAHYDQGNVVVDLILRIVSRQQAMVMDKKGEEYDLICGDIQINFEEIREIMYTLVDKRYNIAKVTYDQFQSVDSRQILEARGFVAGLLSVDKDLIGYDTLKSLISTNRLKCVPHKTFLYESERLELKQGKKVDHPPKGSKDCADAVAGVCRTIMEDFDIVVEIEETEYTDEFEVEVSEQY